MKRKNIYFIATTWTKKKSPIQEKGVRARVCVCVCVCVRVRVRVFMHVYLCSCVNCIYLWVFQKKNSIYVWQDIALSLQGVSLSTLLFPSPSLPSDLPPSLSLSLPLPFSLLLFVSSWHAKGRWRERERPRILLKTWCEKERKRETEKKNERRDGWRGKRRKVTSGGEVSRVFSPSFHSLSLSLSLSLSCQSSFDCCHMSNA